MQRSMQAIPDPCILLYRLDLKKKMKMQAIPDISSIPRLCFRQCHSQDSWGTVSIDILSLSFWFFWVLLTVPYSTFLLTVIYQ